MVVLWEVEFTDEFEAWWDTLSEADQEAVNAHVEALEQLGPQLPFPRSSQVKSSRHGRMRELRVQSRGRPLRVLYVFDPRRVAILLIGGDKTGHDDWYSQFVPLADEIYDRHLEQLEKEDRAGK